MDVAGRTCCSPTVTATLGCDLSACLEVNSITSVLSSFSFSMLLASHLWIRTDDTKLFRKVKKLEINKNYKITLIN